MAEARVKYLQQQAALAAQATPPPEPTQAPTAAAPSKAMTQSTVEEQTHPEVPEKDETLEERCR